jgi:hypothetical protein
MCGMTSNHVGGGVFIEWWGTKFEFLEKNQIFWSPNDEKKTNF